MVNGESVSVSVVFFSLQWRWPPPVIPLPLTLPLLLPLVVDFKFCLFRNRRQIGLCPDPKQLGNKFEEAWRLGTRPRLLPDSWLETVVLFIAHLVESCGEGEGKGKEGRLGER